MEILSNVDDPRQPSNGTRHDFLELLVMTISAVHSDCDTIEDVTAWPRAHTAWLRRFLVLKNGTAFLGKTAQAFYSARYKISALVFADANRQLMARVEEHLPVPRWHWQGLRVIAADGSAVRLTLMKNGVRSIVEGVAFALYLPGIEVFLDFALHEPLCNEQQMLFEALAPCG